MHALGPIIINSQSINSPLHHITTPHQIVERCREAELSPRRRAAAAGSSPIFGGRPTPADLHPAVQRLRATGRIALESLRALMGPEDGVYLEILLCAFEGAELCVRLSPSGTLFGKDLGCR